MALLWCKRVSSLVTCRGRRRIGKSALIKRFAEVSHARFIKIEGLKPCKKYGNEDELRTFASQLAAQTGCERTPPEDWLRAFIRLGREIRSDERTVVLLDEISWLGHYDSMGAVPRILLQEKQTDLLTPTVFAILELSGVNREQIRLLNQNRFHEGCPPEFFFRKNKRICYR